MPMAIEVEVRDSSAEAICFPQATYYSFGSRLSCLVAKLSLAFSGSVQMFAALGIIT